MVERREPLCVAPPAAAEVLVGAGLGDPRKREAAERLLGSLQLLDFDLQSAREAGRIGADLIRAGEPLAGPDLFIAAISLRHGQTLLTRDRAFSRVRGLRVETY